VDSVSVEKENHFFQPAKRKNAAGPELEKRLN
jgi:hypothetical protein